MTIVATPPDKGGNGVVPSRDGGGNDGERPMMTFTPPVDIYETDEALVLTADMPGVTRDRLEITLDEGVLTIDGDIRNHIPAGFEPVHEEYEMGNFRRQFRLAPEIDIDKAEATLENGVLRLRLPRVGSERKRVRIDVE